MFNLRSILRIYSLFFTCMHCKYIIHQKKMTTGIKTTDILYHQKSSYIHIYIYGQDLEYIPRSWRNCQQYNLTAVIIRMHNSQIKNTNRIKLPRFERVVAETANHSYSTKGWDLLRNNLKCLLLIEYVPIHCLRYNKKKISTPLSKAESHLWLCVHIPLWDFPHRHLI